MKNSIVSAYYFKRYIIKVSCVNYEIFELKNNVTASIMYIIQNDVSREFDNFTLILYLKISIIYDTLRILYYL